MQNFTEIIKHWGRDQMAADLGVPKERVRGWERFNKLPQEHWRLLLSKAPERNIAISPDILIDFAAKN